MNWSKRLHTSWELMLSSLRVLNTHRRLLLFPIVSIICGIAMVAFFLVPPFALLAQAGFQYHGEATVRAQITQWLHDRHLLTAAYGYGAVIYLAALFGTMFLNVALYHEILRAFAGEAVSIRRGLRFARTRIRAIFLWSLLAGTVGLVIRSLQERFGIVGRLVLGLIGIAWSVAAVFAIPVIIRTEESNPLEVLRNSAGALKRTWGESLIGFVGIRAASLVVVGPIVLLGVLAGCTSAISGNVPLIISAWVVWIAALCVASLVIGVATDVYRCALYVYASEGVVPGPFTPEMMNAAWKVRKA